MHGLVYVGKANHTWDDVCMEGQACMGWCMYGRPSMHGMEYVWKASMHGLVYVCKATHAWAGVCREGQSYMG